MTRAERLFQLIDDINGAVYDFELTQASSLVQKYDGVCSIAIDTRKVRSERDFNRLLSHELGHIESGAYLDESSPFEPVGRVEYRAKKSSILRTFPIDWLKKSIKENLGNLYDVAEDFESTPEEVEEAIEFYRRKELL